MPNLNLHKGKIKGRMIKRSDIKVGCFVDFPSGLGGSLEYKCTELTDKLARFTAKPGYKDLPSWLKHVDVHFDVEEFTVQEWQNLDMAMKASFIDTDREILHKANDYGYIDIISFTQNAWTEHGIEEFRKAGF